MLSTPVLEDKEQFIQTFGSIFEHSAWIAEAAWENNSFTNAAEVFQAMLNVLTNADKTKKLQLIKAHPQLAGKKAIAGDLTEHSKNEQAGAGLNACTEEELKTITEYNHRYQEKFGFPFIVAVKGLNKYQIIDQFAKRLESNKDTEFDECLKQIIKIAEFRINNIVLD